MDEFRPSLEHLLQEFLGRSDYRPLRQHELARALALKGHSRGELRQALRELESQGKVQRLRKNRWALPEAGRFVTGDLRMNARGFGFVVPDDPAMADIFIPRDKVGVALHGDRVMVSVMRMPGKRKRTRPSQPASAAERCEGQVARILERKHTTLAGLLKKTRYYAYVIPDNPALLHDVRVQEDPDSPPLQEDHKVVVRLNPWVSLNQPLTGVVIEDLGAADEPGVDVLSLMRDYRIGSDFSRQAEEESLACPPLPSPDEIAGRHDLRDWITFTIDPADAKDFDDAVSLTRSEDGEYTLGVHIADVAHYVRPGSALDQEARQRGNSVYLVDRVITMLPRHVTTRVCSLVPEADRLTHSVVIKFDRSGEVVSWESFPSVIHSSARLHYGQVQALFNGDETTGIPDAVAGVLRRMKDFAALLRRRRVQAGSIDFALPEIKCLLDDEGRVSRIVKRGDDEAYHLIEDFMLAANQAVARRFSHSDLPGLYRIHQEPDAEQWALMAEALSELGITSAPGTRAEINEIARSVAGGPLAYSIQLAMLRNFKRACYSGHAEEHFGLAFDRYTHFTSPIRRYPDLVVHRILRALESGSPAPYTRQELDEIARHCSITEREADEAEAESVEMKRVEYYQRLLHAGDTGPYAGHVVDVVPRGLLVELIDTLQRGLVPLPSSPFRRAGKGGRTTRAADRGEWRLGSRVQVELVRVDTARRQIDFRFFAGESARTGGKRERRGKRQRRR